MVNNWINLARSAFSGLQSCHGVSPIFVHIGQGLPGSGALYSALRLRDVASTKSQRNDVGGLWMMTAPHAFYT